MRDQGTHDDGRFPDGFAAGIVFWVVFSGVAVAVRGVRWEETYENALIISRLVPYEDGHPIFQFFRNLFSAQAYLSAAVVRIFPEPLPINAVRNVAYLCFTTIPVFLLGSVLARRALVGHAAVVFILLGAYLNLDSYYPLNTWPTFYSNGHIGRGWALLALGLMLARRWRTAAFLVGLLASVHLGHLPVLLLVALAQLAVLVWRGDYTNAKGALVWGAAGLLISAVLWGVHAAFFKVPPAESGPYAVEGDAIGILRNYLPLHGVHRGYPRFGLFSQSVIASILVLLLCGGGALGTAGSERRRYTWLFAYAALAVAAVLGTRWIHLMMSDETPYVLLRWMPYRLTNHLAVLLIPASCALIWKRSGVWVLSIVVGCAALLPGLGVMLPETMASRYLPPPEWLPYVLAGGAWLAMAPRRWLNWGYWLTTVLLLRALFGFTQYGAACAVAGMTCVAVVRVLANRDEDTREPSPAWRENAVLALCALLLVFMLAGEYREREHLPRTMAQRAVMDYLDEAGEPNAMLLTPYWDVEWTGRTGHPVMADYQTAHHMTYLPYLAPALREMHRELYGFDVEDPDYVRDLAWPSFDEERWTHLARKYRFDYVVAPSNCTVALPRAAKAGGVILYRVPGAPDPLPDQ